MASKQSVLIINMLDAGEMGRNKDLTTITTITTIKILTIWSTILTRAKLLWQGNWVRVFLKQQSQEIYQQWS